MPFCTAAAAALAATLTAPAPQTTTPGATLIDRNRADRALPVAPAARSTPRARVQIAANPVARPITGIRFVGAKAPRQVAAAAQGFLGRIATRQALAELAAALSAAYGESDVALYTIAIPDQSFETGVVEVDLTEGHIAAARLRGAHGGHRLLRARMAALIAQTPLTRAAWERQVTLMQAIPGLGIDTAVTDPHANGALVLTVTPKQRRTRVTAGFSNRGVSLLGDGEFDVKGEAYGLGVDGDQLTLTGSAAPDLQRFRYAGASYAAPLGADGLTATASGAYLETRPAHYPLVGRARQAGLALAYPLVRSFHRSADISLGIDGLDSDNAAFGDLIASDRTRAARLSGSVADTRTRRSVSAALSVSRGLGILGARVAAGDAQTQFTKTTLSAAVDQAIGKRWVARLSASGQLNQGRLPAAERFAIGGEAIGRAFDTGLLTGDRGGGGLGEIAYRPLANGRFATSEVYGFVDGGAIAVDARRTAPAQSYTLASSGVGVRARYREKAELGVEAARSIDDPYAGDRDNWRMSVEWRLTL